MNPFSGNLTFMCRSCKVNMTLSNRSAYFPKDLRNDAESRGPNAGAASDAANQAGG
jgi:hypothetical protein